MHHRSPLRRRARASAVAALLAGAAAAALAVTTPASAPVSAPAADPHAELQQLVERAREAVRTEPETLLRLTDEALARLARRPDPDLEAKVRVLRCDYFNERDRAAAEREIARVHELAPQLREGGHRAGILGCEGELHEQAGDNTRAMALYEQAVSVAEGARDDRRLAEVLYLRGYLHGVVGDFVQGLADLRRSLALYEKLGLAVEMRTAVNGVASLYNRMGDLEQARRYYEDALRTMPEAPPTRERVVAQHNLGRNLERAGRWDEAQHHFEQVLAHSRELHYRRGQVHALRGLAAVRNARGDGTRALRLVDEAQRLGRDVPDEPLRARLLVERATALRLLGRAADGLPALREAIRVFGAGDAILEEGAAREELARTAAALGDWRGAYEEQTRARQIAQDLLRRQIDHRFAAMKAQFDADVRERELVMLQRENHASERALAQQRRAARLQILAAVLASALALLLAVLAWRQHRSGKAMHLLAMTDELTGLPNRRHALAAAEAALAAGGRASLLILDIDHFKRINDRHGHAAGDAVLRAVARAWRGVLTPEITLGRLGGEEFLALLPGGDPAAAQALAERLRTAAAELDLAPWVDAGPLTVSVGITTLGPGDTLSTALARADRALYRAKEAGRDRVEVQA